MKAIVTGSFDPITLGHYDIIKRAASMCDELVVCVFINENKSGWLSIEHRVELLKTALKDVGGVIIDSDSGMVVDYCKKNGITHIIRGFRNSKDYEYELEMAKFNYINGNLKTLLLPTEEAYINVSSSEVRDRITNNKTVEDLVPHSIIKQLREINNARF